MAGFSRWLRQSGLLALMLSGPSCTLRPVAGFGLYASSKLPAGYLVGVLAQEIGEREVTVNAVIATATDGAGYFSHKQQCRQR